MTHLIIAVKTTHGGLWIVPQIREARRRHVRVTVLTPAGQGRLVDALNALVQEDGGVTHVISPFNFSFARPWEVIPGLLRLRRTILELNPTAVLYHLHATAVAIRLATVGLKLRRVYMVAGPLYLESPVIKAVERWFNRLDDHVVCGSRYTYDRYAELGRNPGEMSVIPYGVDTQRFNRRESIDRRALRERLGLSANSFVVIMVAFVYAPKRLVHSGEGIKGHRYLLEAWTEFRRSHPDAELLLVGSGFDANGESYRLELIENYPGRVSGLAATGVRWLESVLDVRDAYAAADVSVSPSLSENHGAALEASAMGLPCIVSDAGALPETVTSQSGWIFDAGSAAGLVECLCLARTEWSLHTLAERGAEARTLMVSAFDVRDLSARVLDLVHE